MTPDRLRGWISRNRVGAVLLQLRHIELDGDGAIFQRWPIDCVDDDPVQAILDASGDYADAMEEDCRIAIEFLNEDDTVIASTVHKAKATEVSGFDAVNAGNISQGTITSQLLRHIEVQQKVLSGSNLGAFQALERVINMQSKLIEKQALQLQSMADQLLKLRAELGEGEGEAEETEEESRARARALDRVTEILPTVAGMAANYMQSKMNGHAAGGETVNGTAHVTGEA